MKGRRFPIIPAFTITINKGDGQYYDIVELPLPTPVLSHGRATEESERQRRPKNPNSKYKSRSTGRRFFTKNIVVKQFLL